jgi:hypothetical protein
MDVGREDSRVQESRRNIFLYKLRILDVDAHCRTHWHAFCYFLRQPDRKKETGMKEIDNESSD